MKLKEFLHKTKNFMSLVNVDYPYAKYVILAYGVSTAVVLSFPGLYCLDPEQFDCSGLSFCSYSSMDSCGRRWGIQHDPDCDWIKNRSVFAYNR